MATADIKGRRRKLLCVKVFSVDLTKCLSWHREMPKISHLNDFPNAEKGERERDPQAMTHASIEQTKTVVDDMIPPNASVSQIMAPLGSKLGDL